MTKYFVYLQWDITGCLKIKKYGVAKYNFFKEWCNNNAIY